MSVFKYADNTEEKPDNHDDLDVVINEGEEDEGEAPLGAEFPTEEDVPSSEKSDSYEDDDYEDEEEDDEDTFFGFKKDKGVK